MRPFALVPDPGLLSARRACVEMLATTTTYPASALVAAAHWELPAAAQPAFVAVVREADASFVYDQSPGLGAALAAAAVIVRLAEDDESALVALLVESARFLGHTPAVAAVSDAAAETLHRLGRGRRQRLKITDTPKEVRAAIAGAPKLDTSMENWDKVRAILSARDSAINAIARRTEKLAEQLEARLQLVEEELDLLWWTRAVLASNIDDEPWESVPAPRRAALAAQQVADRLAYQPAPSGTESLLGFALGADADDEHALGEVAQELLPPQGAPRDPLLPMSTFRSVADVVGPEDRKAIHAAVNNLEFEVPYKLKAPLVDLAEQALREIEILRLM